MNDINRSLEQVFEHGTLPTMVYLMRQNFGERKVARPLHSHSSVCEMVLIFEGNGVYSIGNRKYSVEKGDITLYNQGETHEIMANNEGEIGTYGLGIRNLRLKGFEKNQMVRPGEEYVKKTGNMFPFLKEIFDQIYQMDIKGNGNSAAGQLLGASLISMVMRLDSFKTSDVNNTKNELIAMKIMKYIDENFTQNLTLDSIAQEFRCSSSYVSHAFKETVKMSPIQYMISRRIGLAQNLLISSDMTATQIASHVGYDNSNYFSAVFTKAIGVTPIEYRKYYLEKMKGDRNHQ